MVISAHALATEAGLEVLRDGGNAVDAAIAVHWALAVVAPWAGNIGGGGFLLFRSSDKAVHSLDFRETAPKASTPDMFATGPDHLEGRARQVGHLACGVPGSVAGMYALRDSLGSLPMERLMRPALDLARIGFELTEADAHDLNAKLELLRSASTRPNAFISRPKWSAGDRLIQPDLYATLERICRNGPSEFYTGQTAELILAEMARGKGVMTKEDLANYKAVWREPIQGEYRGLRIHCMGPPSGGGIILLQVLKTMELLDVAAMGCLKAATVHSMVEAERRAYADRAQYLGDPDRSTIPTDWLLSAGHIAQRMSDINPKKATPSAHISRGIPVKESEQTTHFSIVDGYGNAVSCTTTLNGSYGCGVVVGKAGFVLNNEMADFSSEGIRVDERVGAKDPNRIGPGKRMLSSMTPTIITKNDELYMVLGSPGGTTIPTAVLQTVMNVVDHGQSPTEAVSTGRFHHQWRPDSIRVEPHAIAVADSVELVRMGHTIVCRPPMGRVNLIKVDAHGNLEAGVDPRGDDAAGGF